MENMLRIVHYNMYLEYTTGGCNARKNISSLKNKVWNFLKMNFNFFSPSLQLRIY